MLGTGAMAPLQGPAAPQPRTSPEPRMPPSPLLPSYLEVLLEDLAVTTRRHTRFEPPLEVELGGTRGTVIFSHLSKHMYAAIAEPEVPPESCDPLWGRIVEAVNQRFGVSAPTRVQSGHHHRIASWSNEGAGLSLHCGTDLFARDAARPEPIKLQVVRQYSGPPQLHPAQPEWHAPSPIPAGTSFVDVLLKDAPEFLQWDGPRLHGSTVDLAGIPGQVMVQWAGNAGNIKVTLQPVRGALDGCRPVWDRLVGELAERLGAPRELPTSSIRRPLDLGVAWGEDGGPYILALCRAFLPSGEPSPSISLSITRWFNSLS